jgi:hypothetical protein
VLDMLLSVQQPLSPPELARAARFTTEESPDSKGNSQAWKTLAKLLAPA